VLLGVIAKVVLLGFNEFISSLGMSETETLSPLILKVWRENKLIAELIFECPGCTTELVGIGEFQTSCEVLARYLLDQILY
jgi:hypothetical protein